jgi:hypothetical protein
MRSARCFGRQFCEPFLGLSWGPVKGRWYLCGVSPHRYGVNWLAVHEEERIQNISGIIKAAVPLVMKNLE